MKANKIKLNGEVLLDLTMDTATPETVANGVTFHTADGTPSTGTATMGGGVSSWNDLEDKPFGEELIESIEWDGSTEGKYQFEFNGITVLQISDVAISSIDTLIGGSLVLDDAVHELTNEIVLSLGGAIMIGEGILAVPEDNFELAGVLPTSVFFEKKGVYVFNPDQFAPNYVKITFANPIGEIKKIDPKFLPGSDSPYPEYSKLVYSYTHTGNPQVQPTDLDITTGIFTAPAHGFAEGTKVSVAMHPPYNIGAPFNYLPVGLTLGTVSNTGTATSYYFRVVDADHFALSTSSLGEYLTYTAPEGLDVSKFYFENFPAGELCIEGLDVKECLVVIKGRIFNAMRWIRPSNTEIFGTGLGSQMGGVGYDGNFGTDQYGSCYFGRPGYNYVYGTIELKMLGERHAYEIVNSDYVMYSDAGAATYRHNRQYFHMLLSSDRIEGITLDGNKTGAFYNGTTVEVYTK